MIFRDQLNREVEIKNSPPKKIVSLVPSITELLAELGLEEQLTGITKFCIHPQSVFKNKVKVGGTKNINIDKIKSLCPDLIIGNKEENVKEQIEELSNYFPVWMSDVNSYKDAIDIIKAIGIITNTKNRANHLIAEIASSFDKINSTDYLLKNKRVLYLIWYRPYIAVGKQTYIDNLLNKINGENAIINQTRYFEITVEEIKPLNPDYVLLSSEPFPFKEKHKMELQNLLGNQTKVLLIDGEVFSWYGVRMKFLPEYLINMRE